MRVLAGRSGALAVSRRHGGARLSSFAEPAGGKPLGEMEHNRTAKVFCPFDSEALPQAALQHIKGLGVKVLKKKLRAAKTYQRKNGVKTALIAAIEQELSIAKARHQQQEPASPELEGNALEMVVKLQAIFRGFLVRKARKVDGSQAAFQAQADDAPAPADSLASAPADDVCFTRGKDINTKKPTNACVEESGCRVEADAVAREEGAVSQEIARLKAQVVTAQTELAQIRERACGAEERYAAAALQLDDTATERAAERAAAQALATKAQEEHEQETKKALELSRSQLDALQLQHKQAIEASRAREMECEREREHERGCNHSASLSLQQELTKYKDELAAVHAVVDAALNEQSGYLLFTIYPPPVPPQTASNSSVFNKPFAGELPTGKLPLAQRLANLLLPKEQRVAPAQLAAEKVSRLLELQEIRNDEMEQQVKASKDQVELKSRKVNTLILKTSMLETYRSSEQSKHNALDAKYKELVPKYNELARRFNAASAENKEAFDKERQAANDARTEMNVLALKANVLEAGRSSVQAQHNALDAKHKELVAKYNELARRYKVATAELSKLRQENKEAVEKERQAAQQAGEARHFCARVSLFCPCCCWGGSDKQLRPQILEREIHEAVISYQKTFACPISLDLMLDPVIAAGLQAFSVMRGTQ